MNERILIVDDEDMIRRSLCINLGKEGYQLEDAPDGQAAIEMMQRQCPDYYDLVICDIKMPRVGGLEVLRWLRKTQIFTQFIALTGLVDIETAVEVMREGAQDYLIKPVRKQNLLIVVDKALRHCRLLRENRRLEQENLRYQSGLERMVEEKTRTLQIMFRYANRLNMLSSLDQTIKAVIRQVHELTGGGRVAIEILGEEEERSFAVWKGEGVPFSISRLSRINLPEAFSRNMLLEKGSLPDELLSAVLPIPQKPFSIIHVPLMDLTVEETHNPLGVIFALEKEGDRPFTPEDIQILSYIADSASVAISNHINRMRLEKSYRESQMRRELERFHSPAVVDMLMKKSSTTGKLSLEVQEQKVSVVFTDIEAFTNLAEHLSASQVAELLNKYFTRMTDIVFQNEGTLDKYIGDGLMAVFGAPLLKPDDAPRAVRTAIEMRNELFRIMEKEDPRMQFAVRFGVNTGMVVVGNIGSPRRMDYTVLGDVVNVAAGLQENAQSNQILIGPDTYTEVRDLFTIRSVGEMTVKSRHKKVHSYEVL